MFIETKKIRRLASTLLEEDKKRRTLCDLYHVYGIKLPRETEYLYIGTLNDSLKRLPSQLVKNCGITLMGFIDLGPSKEFYPNHGKYMDGALVLNTQLIDDPFLEIDFDTGKALNKFDQILYHEMGHGYDEKIGGNKELSLQPEWLELSGWSEEEKPGLQKVVIEEEGCPKVEGEYYYDPKAQFVRYYGRRNPWDDWADTFSYYVAGLRSFIPAAKLEYFDDKLSLFYGGI